MTDTSGPWNEEPDPEQAPDQQPVMQEFGTPTVSEPARPTVGEIERVVQIMRFEIEQQSTDPIARLVPEDMAVMMRLAYHDRMECDQLERMLRLAMADTYTEQAIRRFSFTTFVRGAAALRRALNEERRRVERIARHNLQVIQGGRNGRPAETRVYDASEVPRAMSPQNMLDSDSMYLMAVGHLMLRRRGRIWHDAFYGDNFTDWEGEQDDRVIEPVKVEDKLMRRIHAWLHTIDPRLGKSQFSNTERAVAYAAEQDRRNEPVQWLRGLVWDGEARLGPMLSKAYACPDDAYHRAVGRCWIMSIVARTLRPGVKVDTMPVFYGPQGLLKSTALEVLGGKWYATINVTAESKDFLDALRGVMVGEIAELDALASSRVEVSRVKTLLSTRVDRFRPSYGRVTVDFPRTCVLAGTTNDPHWHKDDTGGRRFWPVHCLGQIDLGWLQDNRDQLFAEAVKRLGEEGASWWDVPTAEQERLVATHFMEDPWEDRIGAALDRWTRRGAAMAFDGWNEARRVAGDYSSSDDETRWGTFITSARIASTALLIPAERQNRATSLRIAKTMRYLKWERIPQRAIDTEGSPLVKSWRRMEAAHSEMGLESHEPVIEEDIPF